LHAEYRNWCQNGAPRPGQYLLWKQGRDWVLNLALPEDITGTSSSGIKTALGVLSRRYLDEEITSVALPRFDGHQDQGNREAITQVIEEHFSWHPLPVLVYERLVEGVEASEPSFELLDDQEPVLFHTSRHFSWQELSNFADAPFSLDGHQYRTAEHYYQSKKAANEQDEQHVRRAESAPEALQRGRKVEPRPDWDEIKIDTMRTALRAKFLQNEVLAQKLLSSGTRPLHEDSPNDLFWGWMHGEGRDLLGRLLVEVRAWLRRNLSATR